MHARVHTRTRHQTPHRQLDGRDQLASQSPPKASRAEPWGPVGGAAEVKSGRVTQRCESALHRRPWAKSAPDSCSLPAERRVEMTTKGEAPAWPFDVYSCVHPASECACASECVCVGKVRNVERGELTPKRQGRIFFFFFFCACVVLPCYLLRRVAVNHVRHERDLPVQEGGRSQVQWNVVCHHHCDVHSWRNSLNCPTWESTERQNGERGGGRHVSMSAADNISCLMKINVKKKIHSRFSCSASRRGKKRGTWCGCAPPGVASCTPEIMG